MQEEFAKYVEALAQCAASTHRAEDRSLYTSYLADAAGILAAITLAKNREHIAKLIKQHERLWGNTWLQDPVYKNASVVYEQFKRMHGFGI
jgi:hypothetical protein